MSVGNENRQITGATDMDFETLRAIKHQAEAAALNGGEIPPGLCFAGRTLFAAQLARAQYRLKRESTLSGEDGGHGCP